MIDTSDPAHGTTIWVDREADWGTLECACGNVPATAGFLYCDDQGDQVAPDGLAAANLPLRYLWCQCCGLVIDQDTYDATAKTMRVIGRRIPPATAPQP